ncbi:beta-glucanase [[Clostridium] polysaccharolyticum]|uniref:Beta-glucanase n=1 Tax=[Clostridium] polysaccharolyticum TaxID=29364 RepID=A0A1I0A9T8_9FIRM|nr:glycoside hydrolase family 16 protein [[Clostridium] polysaccharolyticum]SES90909.1 Beta-glucanase, GH16 family [[Clostridium] polysaccharolyticum]
MRKFAKKLVAGIACSAMMTLSVLGGAVGVDAASAYSGAGNLGWGFDYHEGGLFNIADGYSNGDMFNCTWRRSNVQFNGGKMNLSLNRDYSGYTGGEYRTNGNYGYGMYDVSMKPASNPGIVSSFFTYTGPSDGTKWDEIDIEFLGKNTRQVQFNYYSNGRGNHEYVYNLGFDASQGFHTYSFLWLPGRISWFVDNREVHTVYSSDVPDTAGHIMMNIWNGIGVDSWLGQYNGRTGLTAQYDWFSYTRKFS